LNKIAAAWGGRAYNVTFIKWECTHTNQRQQSRLVIVVSKGAAERGGRKRNQRGERDAFKYRLIQPGVRRADLISIWPNGAFNILHGITAKERGHTQVPAEDEKAKSLRQRQSI
jgi:hypothetical protein